MRAAHPGKDKENNMEGKTHNAFNKNILIAVDTSENSRRAVAYVGRMLGGMQGYHVTLLHVIPDPEEDYFQSESEREAWIAGYRSKTDAVLKEYQDMLISAGFPTTAVDLHTPRRYCPSMAECILSEHQKQDYSTIVIGRHGLSRKEEFLFGSISNKIVHHARDCAVWVVA
jgi:nucleotide-binding universal stress UspA family protein